MFNLVLGYTKKTYRLVIFNCISICVMFLCFHVRKVIPIWWTRIMFYQMSVLISVWWIETVMNLRQSKFSCDGSTTHKLFTISKCYHCFCELNPTSARSAPRQNVALKVQKYAMKSSNPLYKGRFYLISFQTVVI